MNNKLLFTLGVNQNIIYIYNHKHVEVLLEHSIYEIYRSHRIIGQPKRRKKKLILTIESSKRYLQNFTRSNLQMVPQPEVNHKEISGIFLSKRSLILGMRYFFLILNLLILLETIEILWEPSFICIEWIDEPYKEIPCLMNPLSRRTFH